MDNLKVIKVFIADDHPIVRNGVINILSKVSDISIIGEAGNGSQIETLISLNVPDILLLDLNMPELDPVETTRRLLSKYSSLKIIILSAYDDDAYIKGLLSAGVSGYVLKDEAIETLLTAIRAVAIGESWLSQRISGRIVRKYITSSNSEAVSILTQRELEVLRLLALGMNNDDISEKLFITKRTVQNHVSNIYSKFGFLSRTEAVLYAIKNNIVHISEVKKHEAEIFPWDFGK